MKNLGLQTKEMTLKRTSGDEFQFTIIAGYYYENNEERGVIIEVPNSGIVMFDSHDEYWKHDMDKNFWNELFSSYSYEEITDHEATILSHVVEELRREVETGINQIYVNDETWIDGIFELVTE